VLEYDYITSLVSSDDPTLAKEDTHPIREQERSMSTYDSFFHSTKSLNGS